MTMDDRAHLADFLAAVDEGEADIEAGRDYPYTETTMGEIIAEIEFTNRKRVSGSN